MRHNYYHRTTRHHNTLQTIRSRRAEGWQLHNTHLLQAQHKNIPYAKFVTSVPDERWTQSRTIRTMLRLAYSIMRVLPSVASVGLCFFKTIIFGSVRKIYYICKYDHHSGHQDSPYEDFSWERTWLYIYTFCRDWRCEVPAGNNTGLATTYERLY